MPTCGHGTDTYVHIRLDITPRPHYTVRGEIDFELAVPRGSAMPEGSVDPALARAVVSSDHVHLDVRSTVVGRPGSTASLREPRVEIIRDGNIIRAIDITCMCGEKVRVRLDYE